MSTPTKPLEIELLVSPDERRSSDLPDARRDRLQPLYHVFDEIDYEAAGDPIVDNISQRRSDQKTSSVLAILDQLETGVANR
tara:strand:+ start:880 stop:1125 length:246 start_codon:yes stop_codon:yes gene_type:complete